MTWTHHHKRGEVLRAVLAVADQRRDGLLPTDVDGVAQTFADELDLLGALQLRWHTRLSGHIDRALMEQPMDLEGVVVAAWRRTAREMPGVRAILDHYRTRPTDDRMAATMAKALGKEHLMMAVMAGRGGYADEQAIPIGAALEDRARRADLVAA
jgi:hypothetical protein